MSDSGMDKCPTCDARKALNNAISRLERINVLASRLPPSRTRLRITELAQTEDLRREPEAPAAEGDGQKPRLFPMQDGPPIPWPLAEAIYAHLYRHSSQSLERLAAGGGLGWSEVAFIWSNKWSTLERRKACTAQITTEFGGSDV